MSDRSPTRKKILNASRQLFNRKGYAATPLAEIAAAVGIAPGNLTYHFPAKRDLWTALEANVRQSARAHRAAQPRGDVADDYVECILFSMTHAWENRFLLRDYAQVSGDPDALQLDPDILADLDGLHELLCRCKKEGFFRRDLPIDLRVLARSLFIVSRYWMDHLRESEGLDHLTWTDQERGIQHHFAILLPFLTAAARREFESALLRLSGELAAREASPGR